MLSVISRRLHLKHNNFGNNTFIGILDSFTSGMTLCCSMNRRILTNYTGPLIRVREGGGNTETDIYAGNNGWIDKTALTDFANGEDLFVTKAYAQIGSVDFTQATAVYQPQIATAGTLAEDGDGLSPLLLTGPGLQASVNRVDAFGSDGGVIIVRMFEQTGTSGRGFLDITAEDVSLWATIGSTFYFDYGGQSLGRIYAPEPSGWRDAWHVVRCSRDSGIQEISIDGVSLVTGSKTATNSSATVDFFFPYGTGHGGSELVAWNNGSLAAEKEAAMIVV